MKSKAAIGNHPIHPMLLAVPIGAFALDLLGDVLHTSSPEEPFRYEFSYACIGVGIFVALLAAVARASAAGQAATSVVAS